MEEKQLTFEVINEMSLNENAIPYKNGLEKEFEYNKKLLKNVTKMDKIQYYDLIKRQFWIQKQLEKE